MAATAEQAKYSVQMLVTDWLLVDGTMDNQVQSAIDGAVPDGMREGEDAGEEAQDGDGHEGTAGWDEEGEGGGCDESPGWHDAEGFKAWPAPGQMTTMTLTSTQWSLVVFALRYWADVNERLSDAEGAAKSRAIATAVEQRLAEHGWATGST